MCGIAGYLSFDHTLGQEQLRSMIAVLAHRGPDGEGMYVDSEHGVGLGHRRLSIIDLSDSASQPMESTSGNVMIVFNGEIYNYLELRDELSGLGYTFKTNSDTEVLICAYEHWGASCLEKLDGMFAFVLWDRVTKELFCARDRFGEKPFYYCFLNNQFFFASEMKALWEAGVPKEIDENMLRQFISSGRRYDRTDAERTFYRNIRSLDSAHFLRVKISGEYSVKRYWSLEKIEGVNQLSIQEATERYKELLRLSVERRLRSDVKVGSSLSGGVDSSTLVSIINQFQTEGGRQMAFSARFTDSEKDEGKFIDILKQSYPNVQYYDTYPEELALEDVLEDILYHHEEPVGSSSVVAQWDVMRLAKSNDVTVLLDGQGADEILAGYTNEFRVYLEYLRVTDPQSFKREANAFVRRFGKDEFDRRLKPLSFRAQMSSTVRRLVGMHPTVPSMSEVLHRKLTTFELKELLKYSDRNSMSQSVEVRLPFLFHELVEFCYSLPDEHLIFDGWSKYIHRLAYEDVVPEQIIWRADKLGFEPPQSKWLKKAGIMDRIRSQEKRFGVEVSEKTNYQYTNDLNWNLLMASFF